MNRWRIQPAGPSHAALIAALQARCLPERWSARSIAQVLSTPGMAGFVGSTSNAEPAGYVFGRSSAGDGEVLSLGVLPEHRGRGLGGRLLSAAVDTLLAAGCERLLLEVAESNAQALALYRKYGFAETGRRPGYYRSDPARTRDAILMEWSPPRR